MSDSTSTNNYEETDVVGFTLYSYDEEYDVMDILYVSYEVFIHTFSDVDLRRCIIEYFAWCKRERRYNG